MPLNSSSFISNLIGTGADAPLNLFTVNYVFENVTAEVLNNNSLSYRTTLFTPPTTTVNTQTLNYLGTSVVVPAPGASIDRTVRFTIRADSDYYILQFLRSLLSTDEDGNLNTIPHPYNFDIVVTSYKYEGQDSLLYPAYVWEFHRCQLTTLTPLTLSYEGGQGNYQATFIYKDYEEHLPYNNQE